MLIYMHLLYSIPVCQWHVGIYDICRKMALLPLGISDVSECVQKNPDGVGGKMRLIAKAYVLDKYANNAVDISASISPSQATEHDKVTTQYAMYIQQTLALLWIAHQIIGAGTVIR